MHPFGYEIACDFYAFYKLFSMGAPEIIIENKLRRVIASFAIHMFCEKTENLTKSL